MTDLPEPLTPPDCDLRAFRYFELDAQRLEDSDFMAITSGDEFKAGVRLWIKAWRQVPAASLPDDDRVLAHLAGVAPEAWPALRTGALHGFVKCSDGRLYHPTLAEKAREAWASRERQKERANKRWSAEKPSKPPNGRAEKPKGRKASSARDAVAMPRHCRGIATAMPIEREREREKEKEVVLSPPPLEFKTREETPPPQPCARARDPAAGCGGGASPEVWKNRLSEGIAALNGAANQTTGGLASWAALKRLTEPPPDAATGPPCDWDADVLPAIAAVGARLHGRGQKLRAWTHPAIAEEARANRDARVRGDAGAELSSEHELYVTGVTARDRTAHRSGPRAGPTRNSPGAQRQVRLDAWAELLAERGELEALGPGAAAGRLDA
ncbi:MAG: DUF1376 domain-containing protein [Hyphomonadaceae bacterium]|nr:DUF1376 domain-containing protein [Hyphomonadaceae bacterium]